MLRVVGFPRHVGWVLALAACAACHLADEDEPTKCAEGTHLEFGRCAQDETEKLRIVLTPSGTCVAIAPDTITVKVDERFQFENKDTVPHTMKGVIDGQTWVSAEPGQLSLGMSIAKAGTWKYVVAECGSTGTVVVQ